MRVGDTHRRDELPAGLSEEPIKERDRPAISKRGATQMALDAIEGLDPEVVRATIEARETELRAEHPSVLGMQRVLHQSPFDRPKWSKRSAMPLCLYTCREAKRAFVAGWFAFLDRYRAASEAFRAGDLGVRFPMFSFRPMTPAE